MNEEWRDIPGYEGLYQASSEGRVRSVPRVLVVRSRGGLAPRPFRGTLLKPRLNIDGYNVITLNDHGAKATARVSRLVCITFHGRAPEGLITGHLNGVRTDDRPENLAWISFKENQDHRVLHGTDGRGAKNPHSKLTDKQVIEIRRMASQGEKNKSAIARIFNVSPQAIWLIVNRINWRHI